jgi:hypothetical protein
MHRRTGRQLQTLARQWQMHYSRRDQLRLAARVADGFPVPGAANLRVTDLVYGLVGDSHRYIFTAEYTVGVLRAKRRVLRVASFSESRSSEDGHAPITLADPDQPLIEQYRAMAPAAK